MILNKVVVGRVVRAYRAAKGNNTSEYEKAIAGLIDPTVCGHCWSAATIKRHVQKTSGTPGSALCIAGIIIDYQVGVPTEVSNEILDDIDAWLYELDLPLYLDTESVTVKSRRLYGSLLATQRLIRATRDNVINGIKEYC